MTQRADHRKRLLLALGITSVVMVAEIVGSILTDSLALLADAGHMFTDAAGIVLAILALSFASRAATPTRTFGYYRLEILAAVVNALLLFGVGVFILYEAWQRWSSPPEVHGGLMLVFALIGLVANVIGIRILHAGAQESLNVKGAYLEVLGDLFGSIAAIVAAILIAVFGWERADVVASVAVALLILPRTVLLLREAVDVLLEATPRGLDLATVRSALCAKPGVLGVHDVHAWAISSGLPVISLHVVVAEDVLANGGGATLLDELAACLSSEFRIEHSTIQLEPLGHAAHEFDTHD